MQFNADQVKLFIFVSLWSLPGLIAAQTVSADSTSLTRAMQYQRDKYRAFVQANSSLYNGYEYKEFVVNNHDLGIPYFLSNTWQNGTVVYNDQLYTQVDLLYDIVNNKVITHPYNSIIKVELIYDKIEQFTIQNHVFVRLKDLTGTDNFYERLVDGKSALYALRKKVISKKVGSGKVTQVFTDKSVYFILINGKLVPLKTRSDLFKAIPESKSQIKEHLAEKKIRFGRNFEQALIESVSVHNMQSAN